MGQRDGFSDSDVAKLNAMYSCDSSTHKPSAGRPAAVTATPAKPTATAASPHRPNRPVLNFLGHVIKPFFHEGDGEDNDVNGSAAGEDGAQHRSIVD